MSRAHNKDGILKQKAFIQQFKDYKGLEKSEYITEWYTLGQKAVIIYVTICFNNVPCRLHACGVRHERCRRHGGSSPRLQKRKVTPET